MGSKGRIPVNKEDIFRFLLYAGDILRILFRVLKHVCLFLFSLASVLFFLLFLYYIGFEHTQQELLKIKAAFRSILILLFITKLIIGIYAFERGRIMSLLSRAAILVVCLIIILSNSVFTGSGSGILMIARGTGLVIAAGFLLSTLEIYRLFALISSANFPPSLVFAGSFLSIIIIGAGLLMLPKSTTIEISVIDTLFTSASAVCVTGLTVVDTATSFTLLGHVILLCLIQIGGLGIMTFTGFFSYIFTSRSTLQERMLLQEIFSSESLGNLYKILVKIILFTLLVEGAGALIIYSSLDAGMSDRLFFSVFHSVSAFCNAGFSTLTDNLMDPGIIKNYTLLTTISLLIIMGGLGFPVVLRLYSIIKSKLLMFYDTLVRRRLFTAIVRMDPGSKIAFSTTVILIAAGTLVLFFLESPGSMQAMSTGEKIFLSYFNSVTSRTAGFNMSDLTQLAYPSVFIIIVLMWIGASPGSTGGGIKTTTFAVALRSAWSNIRGRKNLELAGREITPGTISRVLSIILLSVITLSAGFFCLLISDPDKDPMHLLFETVSAYSTVGLTIAGTPTISDPGKIVLILLMFIGRVGPLTLLTGIFISSRKRHHVYPPVDVIIN